MPSFISLLGPNSWMSSKVCVDNHVDFPEGRVFPRVLRRKKKRALVRCMNYCDHCDGSQWDHKISRHSKIFKAFEVPKFWIRVKHMSHARNFSDTGFLGHRTPFTFDHVLVPNPGFSPQ